MPLPVGTYSIAAPGATVTPRKVRVRDSRTSIVRITFPPPRPKNGVSLISTNSQGYQAGKASTTPVWSPDGRRIAFASGAKNLLRKRSNGLVNVYVKDLRTGRIRLISKRQGPLANLGAAEEPTWSPDGKSLAFTAISGRTSQAVREIFVATLATGELRPASTTGEGAAGNGHSSTALWSPDGQRLAFTSQATNLVAGDTNSVADLFVKDLLTGAVQRVSTASNGRQLAVPSYPFGAAWSPDGTQIAFISMDRDLVPGTGQQCTGVYVRSLGPDVLRCLSAPETAGNVTAADGRLSWSPDGTRLAFGAWISPADRSGDGRAIVVADLATSAMQRVAPDGATLFLDRFAKDPAWSPDGIRLAYVMGGFPKPGNTGQITVEELVSGTTLQLGQATSAGGTGSWAPDGTRYAFSTPTALLSGDTNRVVDIYSVTVR